MNNEQLIKRYFLSYRGVKLPLQLLEELPESALRNRNTWFTAMFDQAGCIRRIEKRVYGELEMSHQYEYEGERLSSATIQVGDEEPVTLEFKLPIPK
jgi:hypothetical protein